MVKKEKLGKVYKQINGFTVRCMPKGESGYGIYAGKRLITGNIKDKDDAVNQIPK